MVGSVLAELWWVFVISVVSGVAGAAGLATWRVGGRFGRWVGDAVEGRFERVVRRVVEPDIKAIHHRIDSHMEREENELRASREAQQQLIGRFDEYRATNDREHAELRGRIERIEQQ